MHTLIIILFGAYGYGDGKAIATIDFSTRSACESAAVKFYQQIPTPKGEDLKYYMNGVPKAFCVSRG